MAALAFFPGLWLYPAYVYSYNNPYYWRNGSRNSTRLRDDDDDDDDLNGRRRFLVRRQTTTDNSNENGTVEVLPIICLCQQYSECSCDDNSDSEFLTSILPNDTAELQLDESLVRVTDVNGTRSVVLNGTLENGTTAPDEEVTASPTSTPVAGVSAAGRILLENAGWWVMVFIVGWTVWSV